MQVFLNREIKQAQQQLLSSFYTTLIDNIRKFLLENQRREKLMIEPFNYDVSQILFQHIGIGPLRSETSDVIFGPHIYEPSVFSDYRRIIVQHLIQQQALNIPELIIGEVGDLTKGKHPEKLIKQLQLLVVDLDLPVIIWEFDPNQNSDAFANAQDCYPWNCEDMSIVDDGTKPSQLGMPVLNWWHAQSVYTRRIMISYTCS